MSLLVFAFGLSFFVSAFEITGAQASDSKPASDVTAARPIDADREPGNWLSHGRTYSEQRFSPVPSENTIHTELPRIHTQF